MDSKGASISALLLLSLCACALGRSRGDSVPIKRHKMTVAVLPLTDHTGDARLSRLSSPATDVISMTIAESGRVNIVERERISDVLGEMRLAATGAIDPESAAKIGRLLGANSLVFGGLSDMGNGPTITLRLVDVESGRILCGATEFSKGEPDASALARRASLRLLANPCLVAPE